jgi:hypothetical protein
MRESIEAILSAPQNKMLMLVHRRNTWLVLALLVIAAAGCEHGPRMYKVSGKVTFKGGPMPHAGVCTVQFIPSAGTSATEHKGAGGAINPDGTFEMHTRKPGDGVVPGEYDVTFAIWPGPMDPRPLVLPKYTSPSATPYKNVKIDRDISDLEFEVEPLPGGAPAAAAKTGG